MTVSLAILIIYSIVVTSLYTKQRSKYRHWLNGSETHTDQLGNYTSAAYKGCKCSG